MKSIFRNYVKTFLLVFLFFPAGAVAQTQPLALKSMSYSNDNFLKLDYVFTTDVTSYPATRLNLRTINSGAAVGTLIVSRSEAANGRIEIAGSRVTFEIPFSKLESVYRVEAWVTLVDSQGSEPYVSPESSVDINQIRQFRSQREEFERLRTELEEKRKENTDLSNRIGNLVARQQATQIEFTDHFVSSNRIAIQYRLNNIGAVRATLTSNAPGSGASVVTSKYSETPIIEFSDLVENREYTIKAQIIDISDPERVTAFNHQRAVRTDAVKDKVDLTQMGHRSSPEGHLLEFNATDTGVGEIEFCQRLSDFQCGTPRIVSGRKIEKDGLGRYKGLDIRRGLNRFVLDNTVPGQTYRISIRVYNQHGRLTERESADIAIPEIKKLAFDSAKPLTLDASPLGITLSWKANFKPKEANFVVNFEGQGIFTSDKARASISESGDISITLPVEELTKILNSTNDPSKKSSDRPRLRAQMTDEANQSVWQELRFTYSLPTKAEINEARQKGLITDGQKKDIEEVVSKAVEGKRVDWGKIFKTGLSIFLKFAL